MKNLPPLFLFEDYDSWNDERVFIPKKVILKRKFENRIQKLI